MADLATTLRRLTNPIKDQVIPFDEGNEVGVVPWIGDTIPVLVPV